MSLAVKLVILLLTGLSNQFEPSMVFDPSEFRGTKVFLLRNIGKIVQTFKSVRAIRVRGTGVWLYNSPPLIRKPLSDIENWPYKRGSFSWWGTVFSSILPSQCILISGLIRKVVFGWRWRTTVVSFEMSSNFSITGWQEDCRVVL